MKLLNAFQASSNAARINRNMGCIETCLLTVYVLTGFRLIETWDVLKRMWAEHKQRCDIRLIETWDVLKHVFADFAHIAVVD